MGKKAPQARHRYDLRYLPVNCLVPSPSNVNEMDEANYARLVEEVTEGGVIESLSVAPLHNADQAMQVYRIVGGEHRWRAAIDAGESEVPCLILKGARWEDQDLLDFTLVRLNVIRGKVNPEKFLKLYNRVSGQYGPEATQLLLGFVDEAAFQQLLRQARKQLKETLPKEYHKDIDKELKGAKTADDLAAIVQNLIDTYGATMEYSFMVFAHGEQEHIYVQMDRRMQRTMANVMAFCQQNGVSINEVLAPAIESSLRKVKRTPDT